MIIYKTLAINIINKTMKFSFIKSKAVQDKVREQLELLIGNEEELKELLSK